MPRTFTQVFASLGSNTAQYVDFFTDSVRMIIMGGVSPFDLEAMMDADLEVHHHEALKPASAPGASGAAGVDGVNGVDDMPGF